MTGKDDEELEKNTLELSKPNAKMKDFLKNFSSGPDSKGISFYDANDMGGNESFAL